MDPEGDVEAPNNTGGEMKIIKSSNYFLKDIDFIMIEDVIREKEFLKTLIEDLGRLPLKKVSNDLMHLQQLDLTLPSIKSPAVQKLIDLVKNQIKPLMEDLYKFKAKDMITMTCSKYSKNDYLLCHDDKYGDRHVAFVLYLTPKWTPEDGGMLRFFAHKPATKEPINQIYEASITPEFNSLVAFRVCEISHHEVEQVYSNKDRVSVNGWFHLDSVTEDTAVCPHVDTAISRNFDNDESSTDSANDTKIKNERLEPCVDMLNMNTRVVDKKYCGWDTVELVKKNLQKCGIVQASEFLDPEFYNRCCSELRDSTHDWLLVGPANRRSYHVLNNVSQIGKGFQIAGGRMHFLQYLLSFAMDTGFLMLLRNVTGLHLGSDPKLWIVEIAKWTQGSYVLLADNKVENPDVILVECTFYFSVWQVAFGPGVSGNIFFSSNHPNYAYEKLAKRKCNRMFGDIMLEPHLKKPKLTKQMKVMKAVAVTKDIRTIVKDKVAKMITYRRENGHPMPTAPTQFVPMAPISNSLVIKLLPNGAQKFSSYIRKTQPPSNRACYYTVKIAYPMFKKCEKKPTWT